MSWPLLAATDLSPLSRFVALAILCVLVFAFLLARFELVHAATSGGGGENDPSTKRNCPACGARTAATGECEYCGENFDA